jgi:hypothetical protein
MLRSALFVCPQFLPDECSHSQIPIQTPLHSVFSLTLTLSLFATLRARARHGNRGKTRESAAVILEQSKLFKPFLVKMAGREAILILRRFNNCLELIENMVGHGRSWTADASLSVLRYAGVLNNLSDFR